MPLLALTSGLYPWIAPLVGTSVFGLTASVGSLITGDVGTENQEGLVLPKPETTAALAKDRLKWRGSDRRELFRRYGTPIQVVVADEDRDEVTTGWVVDRSTGGLGLEVDVPVPAGVVLNLRPSRVPGTKLWVEGVVRNCRDQFDYWKVGLQFVQTPPWSVLRLFG